MSKRDIRMALTPQELDLFYNLLLFHILQRTARQEIEPWEAKLLAKIGRSHTREGKRGSEAV